MTKTTKYCMHPVEDGRCGKPFTTYSIRSFRKYCDEHEPKRGLRAKSSNTISKVQTQEEMAEYVMSEMNSKALSRSELNQKIIRVNERVNSLQESVEDITNKDVKEYTVKQHKRLSTLINKRVDTLFRREMVKPLEKEKQLMNYILKLNDRISVLEKDLDRAYIALSKKQKPLKRTNKNKNKNEEKI